MESLPSSLSTSAPGPRAGSWCVCVGCLTTMSPRVFPVLPPGPGEQLGGACLLGIGIWVMVDPTGFREIVAANTQVLKQWTKISLLKNLCSFFPSSTPPSMEFDEAHVSPCWK